MQGLLRNHPRTWIGVALGIGVLYSLLAGWLLVPGFAINVTAGLIGG
jgi:hypothetical protein